ncbi:MAG TPA: hypothetical protein VM260_13770, partial [Pirellula sp.]|nr:hypothetical protein [Pirellula sp.]
PLGINHSPKVARTKRPGAPLTIAFALLHKLTLVLPNPSGPASRSGRSSAMRLRHTSQVKIKF